jgi:hypothetical protein
LPVGTSALISSCFLKMSKRPGIHPYRKIRRQQKRQKELIKKMGLRFDQLK